ncbi:PREDICTED: protein SFI1 homolog [Branchiostoma belcheri]|uniref:Protein SFI1 homolog n=1 Tax=Branchiostoma belcheri TaxID=7741 RepID=A0A6P4ZY24_BRABE|nr:PREDICTED: protein SFI1 homolog [Branchiostoma belcheri]
MKNNLARETANRKLTKGVWEMWVKKCEHREELKLLPVTRRARHHHRQVKLKKTWTIWTAYVQWRRHREAQYIRADAHYASRCLPRTLERWRWFVGLSQEKKDRQLRAVTFRREALQARFFYGWWTATQQSRDLRLMERMAILHHNGAVIKAHLKLWRLRAKEVRREQEKEFQSQEVAVQHYKYHLCLKAVQQWKDFTLESITRQEQDRLALRHQYRRQLRRVWTGWTQYLDYRRSKLQRKARGDQHYQKHILGKVMQAWKLFHGQAKRVNAQVQQRVHNHNIVTLSWALATWHENVRTERQNQHKESQAQKHRERQMMKLLLKRQSEWLCRTRLTAKFFHLWKHQLKLANDEREKTTQALWHWSVCLQYRTLQAWLHYTADRRRRADRIAIAMETRRRRLLREGVAQWLAMATDMADMRSNMAAQRQAEVAYGTFQIVRKCAMRWREKTLAGRRNLDKGLNRGGKTAPVVKDVSSVTRPTPSVASPVRPIPADVTRGLQVVDRTMAGPYTGRRDRPRPRHPDFLADSLKREGLLPKVPRKMDRPIPTPCYAPDQDLYLQQQGNNIVQVPTDIADQLTSTDETPPPKKPPTLPTRDPSINDKTSGSFQTQARVTDTRRCPADKDHDLESTPSSRPGPFPPQSLTGMTEPENAIQREKMPSSPPRGVKAVEEYELIPPSAFMVPKTDKQVANQTSPKQLQGKDSTLMPPAVFTSPGKEDSVEDAETRRVSYTDGQNETEEKGGDRSSHPQNGQKTVLEEMLHIKEAMQRYKENRKRLKRLEQHYKQLSSWLKQQQHVEGQADEVLQQVRLELQEIETEKNELSTKLQEDRPTIETMTARAQDILAVEGN